MGIFLFQRIGFIILATALIFGAVACAPEPAAIPVPTPMPEPAGVYVEGIAGFPQAVNPLFSLYNDVDRDLCALVFEGLVSLDQRGLPVPQLAESWDISIDGLTYTFRLRKDVYWHDGAPFTADDVVFTVRTMSDPDFLAFDASGMFDLWSSVVTTRVDKHTLRFELPQPYAPFLDYATTGILPAHLLSAIEVKHLPKAQFNSRPIGTGPFKVTSVSAQQVVLTANPTYYRSRPRLQSVVFRFYPDAESLFAAYEKGEIDGISQVTAHLYSRLKVENSLTLYSARMAKYAMVLFNLAHDDASFFAEKEVRQALLWGLDREALINRAVAGHGTIAHSPMMPDTWAYHPEIEHYPYDPDKSRAVLEAAGWKDIDGDGIREKNGIRLEFTIVTSDDPSWDRVVQMISRQWREIGVEATPEVVTFPQLVGEYLYPRRFEAILIAPEFAGDPDPYPLWHSTQRDEYGQNWSGFSNRRADEIMEEARLTHDQGLRIQLYREFQELFVEEVPALLLYYPIYSYAINSRVQNVQIAPMNSPSDRFRTISSWTIASRKIPLISRVFSREP